MSVPYSLDYCSFVVSVEIGNCDSSRFVLFFMIVLAILSLLHFHVNFRIKLSISVKNVVGILIGIALNLWSNLGSIHILMILSLPIHVCQVSLHLLRSSLISFNNVL